MSKQESLMEKATNVIAAEQFSGAVYVKQAGNVLIEQAFGFADRSEERLNTIDTRFGIASGCKLFTSIAVCQLVEKGVLSFHTRLKDCLEISFPHFDERVTIHQLLTHSSGIPDYFDEETMDDFEELWKQTPMYLLRDLKKFLPLFQKGIMEFKPGEKFHYNNAGYIVLGLIIEQQTGQSFTDYVEENIFRPTEMNNTGYFSLDQLPRNTANGYIQTNDGTWRTNIYSIPVRGGADGGAFTTARDMNKLWEALIGHRLLSKEMTEKLLTPHVQVKERVEYGYGVWINRSGNNVFKYHVMGYDPGVSFHSAYYPATGTVLVIPSNQASGPSKVMKAIEGELLGSH
ncbi:serine hydrolase domain-containing protein [Sediminibacillus albus]|nr:serine hydrolase domain-containing protein [Sediminibacillus albus]